MKLHVLLVSILLTLTHLLHLTGISNIHAQKLNVYSVNTSPITTSTTEYYPFTVNLYAQPYRTPHIQAHIALQVGHWNNRLLPDELARLRDNHGAASGAFREWQINYVIAHLTKNLLESEGIHVDILPATVPPGYTADAFIAIHADQNPNRRLTGFKASGAWNDTTGRAAALAKTIEAEYIATTGMKKDTHVTRGMTEYYAFNRLAFVHSIAEETPGVIVENGFLTHPSDQHMLLHYPEIPARGLANGIIRYLNEIN